MREPVSWRNRVARFREASSRILQDAASWANSSQLIVGGIPEQKKHNEIEEGKYKSEC